MTTKNLLKKNPQKKRSQISNQLERSIIKDGYEFVVGVDEVGRGCLAGPVVAGAFLFTSDAELISGVNDSKQVPPKQRERISDMLKKSNSYGIGVATVGEIFDFGIVGAIRNAMLRALEGIVSLRGRKYRVLFDGHFKLPFDFDHECIIKGDEKHYSIAAASIIAKVHRDSLMRHYSKIYPNYGFERHVGYGTANHLKAIYRYGVCELHRKNFKPIKDLC